MHCDAGVFTVPCYASTAVFPRRRRRAGAWPAGPKPHDGVWAPHWYNAVHLSTGFEEPEGDLPRLPADLAALAEAALPYYEQLSRHGLGG